jgi:uncharacterized short protein YbdD (DUF466 family)
MDRVSVFALLRCSVARFRRSHVPPFPRSLVPTFLRQLAGMPDYAAHVEHLRRHHPQAQIPTEQQYYAEFVRARYEDGPTRCC